MGIARALGEATRCAGRCVPAARGRVRAGLGFAWAFGYGENVRRTISIEVGMQDSGLGAALAKSNFASMPLAPTPCAISAVFHSVIGSVLAGIWRLRPPKS